MRVVGMISGTSMDGIDVAVADLQFAGDTVELRPLGAASREYPAELRARVGAVLPPAATTAEEVCRLDTLVGQAFAAAATFAVDELGAGAVDLIVSHGQTIFHWVDPGGRRRGTLQVGQPAWIVEATGIPVVADLRSRDIAAGGHGAPLASTLDELLLGGSGETAAALNLGGISNMTVVGPDAPTIAFDIGPANALIDAAVGMPRVAPRPSTMTAPAPGAAACTPTCWRGCSPSRTTASCPRNRRARSCSTRSTSATTSPRSAPSMRTTWSPRSPRSRRSPSPTPAGRPASVDSSRPAGASTTPR